MVAYPDTFGLETTKEDFLAVFPVQLYLGQAKKRFP